jgi:arylsulfatase
MDTPFQWTKQVASHFGGTRNGLVMAWPKRIKARGEIRPQFHHVIDILPTVLEATGLPAPRRVYGVEQDPIEGVSMAYTWDEAQAPSRRTTQYFEMFANRAIYQDGWVAATTPTTPPWVSVAEAVDPIDGYKWELYHVAEDFSQATNLAASQPDKLRELQRAFYIEAVKYNALPLDNSKVERLDVNNRPSNIRGVNAFTYYDGMVRIPEGSAPDLKNKSFGISAVVDIPEGGAEGVLMTQGGRFAGVGLYMRDGRPVFHYNLAGVERYTVAGEQKLAPGRHVVTLDFNYDGGGVGKGGQATLTVDGKTVGSGKIPKTIAFRMSLDETLDIGQDTGTPVSEEYQVPFDFTGTLEQITIHIAEHKLTDEELQQYREGRLKAALAQ